MRFRIGWKIAWIGLRETWLVTLPIFVPLFAWQAYVLLRPGAQMALSPHYVAGCSIGGALWLCVGLFWSRALAAYVAPAGEEEEYAQAPVPFYFALLFLFVGEIILAPYLSAWFGTILPSQRLPLYARVVSIAILVIGYEIGYRQGPERGIAARKQTKSRFARLLTRGSQELQKMGITVAEISRTRTKALR